MAPTLLIRDEILHLSWSKHCTTFPKVPSPKVLTISSGKENESVYTATVGGGIPSVLMLYYNIVL